jgi:hypothetical protein
MQHVTNRNITHVHRFILQQWLLRISALHDYVAYVLQLNDKAWIIIRPFNYQAHQLNNKIK